MSKRKRGLNRSKLGTETLTDRQGRVYREPTIVGIEPKAMRKGRKRVIYERSGSEGSALRNIETRACYLGAHAPGQMTSAKRTTKPQPRWKSSAKAPKPYAPEIKYRRDAPIKPRQPSKPQAERPTKRHPNRFSLL